MHWIYSSGIGSSAFVIINLDKPIRHIGSLSVYFIKLSYYIVLSLSHSGLENKLFLVL